MIVLLAASVLLGCSPAQRQRAKGFGDSGTTAAELERALTPRRVAVVIGIDSWEDPAFPPLRHAQRDASAMGDVLGLPDTGGFDEVIRLVGPDSAIRTRILETLRDLRARLRQQDSLLVYFSGHGTRRLVDGAWRRFLLPHDARVADLPRTSIDLADLQAFLRTLRSERIGLVVDACFHGGGKSVGGRTRESSDPLVPGLAPGAGIVHVGEAHLFATSSGRPAREDDRLGHGVYTHYLLEAMQWGFDKADVDGDGVLSAWEAHDHARARTLERTDGVQVPEAAIRTVGEADLVLAGSVGRRRDVERSLVYLYDGAADLDGARVFVDGRERGVFPGTLVVSPTTHHVVVRQPDGKLLVDGDVPFRSGAAYRIEDLVRITAGPSRALGARATTWVTPAFDEVGPVVAGIEAFVQGRLPRGPLRGLYVEGAIGFGGSPGRTSVAGPVRDARTAVSGALTGGLQRDVGALRLRGNLSVAARVFPPNEVDGSGGGLTEVGLWHVAAGPGGGVGLARGRWAGLLEARLLGSWLDLEGTGQPRLVPTGWVGLTLESSALPLPRRRASRE